MDFFNKKAYAYSKGNRAAIPLRILIVMGGDDYQPPGDPHARIPPPDIKNINAFAFIKSANQMQFPSMIRINIYCICC